MKRKSLVALLVASLMIGLAACATKNNKENGSETKKEAYSENETNDTMVSTALEKGLLAVENNDLEVAKDHFQLVLIGDPEHEEALQWIEFIEYYNALVKAIDDNQMDEAQTLLTSLQEHKHASALNLFLEQVDSLIAPDVGIYMNEELGLMFNYPKSWLNHIDIREIQQNNSSKSKIDIFYVNPQKGIEEVVFGIVKHEQMIKQEDLGMETYITNNGIDTYTLAMIGDPGETLVKPENQTDLTFAQNMMYEVDQLIESFTLMNDTEVAIEEAAEKVGEDNEEFMSYLNKRFEFIVDYPVNAASATPSENGDGMNFHEMDFNMVTYASHSNVVNSNETIEDYYFQTLDRLDSVSYKRLEYDWYVITYEENGRIFYIKGLFNDLKNATLIIDYPISQKDKYNAITNHISKSFSFLDN